VVVATIVGLALWLPLRQAAPTGELQEPQRDDAAAATQSDTVVAETPAPVAAPITALVPDRPTEQPETIVKWTSTWVNVRDGRSPAAAILRVLDPGERVEVADLQRGWWAVYSEGVRIGYVARSLMRDEPLENG
jgi:hypothetical protein